MPLVSFERALLPDTAHAATAAPISAQVDAVAAASSSGREGALSGRSDRRRQPAPASVTLEMQTGRTRMLSRISRPRDGGLQTLPAGESAASVGEAGRTAGGGTSSSYAVDAALRRGDYQTAARALDSWLLTSRAGSQQALEWQVSQYASAAGFGRVIQRLFLPVCLFSMAVCFEGGVPSHR